MNYYEKIKNELVNNEISRKVKNYSINRNDINTYYKVGKMLSEAGKHYGEVIIKEYSKKLTLDLGKGYSKRNLWLMLKFYELNEKVQTLSTQLTMLHYIILFSLSNENEINYYIFEKGVALQHQLSWLYILSLLPISDINEINYYIDISIKQNLSYRKLRNKIKIDYILTSILIIIIYYI